MARVNGSDIEMGGPTFEELLQETADSLQTGNICNAWQRWCNTPDAGIAKLKAPGNIQFPRVANAMMALYELLKDGQAQTPITHLITNLETDENRLIAEPIKGTLDEIKAALTEALASL